MNQLKINTVILKKLIISFVICFFVVNLCAQVNDGDCKNALRITDTTTSVLIANKGFGQTQEMWGTKEEELYFFTKEVNSSWYKFTAPFEGILSFEIDPVNANSDIDFLLFTSKNENICESIQQKKIKPIRSNAARNDGNNHGLTGLSTKGTTNYMGIGVGNSFSNVLETKKNEEYYLLLNNLTEQEMGHRVRLHFQKRVQTLKQIPKYTTNSVKKDSKQVNKDNAGISLKVHVVDSKEGKPINVTLEVDGILSDSSVVVKNKSSFTYILDKGKRYLVKCIYQGFMLYSEEVVAPKIAKKIDLKIVLDPIEKGAKVALHNIRFKPNGSKILQSSESELQALFTFMRKNPDMSIKINGHVNAPKMKNTSEIQKMSRDRAKAVYLYLIRQGVSKKRLKFEGFGNEQMEYPVPITHVQERANRRVEIEIL